MSNLLNKVRAHMRSNAIKGLYKETFKNIADTGSDDDVREVLQSIAEQANDDLSYNRAKITFGEQLVHIAQKLYPNQKHPSVEIPLDEAKIKGGLADNLKPKDIADKFDLPVSKVNRELQMGIKVEMEHTKNRKMAEDIAMDHLYEIPDYYTRLKKMEKQATTHWNKKVMKESIKTYVKMFLNENVKKTSVINLLNDFGMLISLNFSQITKMGKDEAATKELVMMMQNLRKPIINGQTYFDLIKDINPIIGQPKMLSAVLGKIREFLMYIEPRVQRFVIDGEYKTKWMEKIKNLKNLYLSVIQ